MPVTKLYLIRLFDLSDIRSSDKVDMKVLNFCYQLVP